MILSRCRIYISPGSGVWNPRWKNEIRKAIFGKKCFSSDLVSLSSPHINSALFLNLDTSPHGDIRYLVLILVQNDLLPTPILNLTPTPHNPSSPLPFS
jgi:hypothetical protein